MKFIIVKTSFPKLDQAKKLAEILLSKKLASCIQMHKIESSYLWEGKINHADEILVEIKAKATFYEKIEKEILANHVYDTPEIIVVNIEGGLKAYLDWMYNI